MSRLPVRRRRRNPDDDVLFPYSDRFSPETFPSLTYPDYSTTLVARRGATARAPSQVDGNLVFDAFFGEGMFEDFLTNPRAPKGQKFIDILAHLNTYKGLSVVAESLRDATDTDFDEVIAMKDGTTAMAILREGIDSGIISQRAGDFYDEVCDALRVRRRNPLSEDGMIVNGVAAYREMLKSKAGMKKKPAKKTKKRSKSRKVAQVQAIMERVRAENRLKRAKHAGANRAHMSYAAEEYMDNPAKKAPAAKKKAPAKRRASAASRAASGPVAPAMAEVMHEDGGYEVVTAKGKKFSWDDLRDIIGCELLEFVPLGGGRVMAVNEEGRMHGAGINPGASLLVRTAIFGPAVVLARSALK